MQIFNFKRVLGLLAIGGTIAYVRKQGGVRNAVDSLKKLASGFGGKAEHSAIGSSSRAGDYRPGRAPSASVTPHY